MSDYYFTLYVLFIVVIFLFSLYHGVNVLLDKKTGLLHKFVAVLVIVYVIYLGINRNTYLPFLGPTVFPYSLLKEPKVELQPGDIQTKVNIDAPDGTKVLYWAAITTKEKEVIETPTEAYSSFENAAIGIVKNKEVSFFVKCPSSYKVPMKILSPHVHYRIVYKNGLLGSVKTVFVNC